MRFALSGRFSPALRRPRSGGASGKTTRLTTLARNPAADLAHNNPGFAPFRTGRVDKVLLHFRRAVELRPDSAHAHNNLANALHMTSSVREAIADYELSLKLEPANARRLNNLAMLLACSWDASVRDGKRAVECAQTCEITGKPWLRQNSVCTVVYR